MECCAHIGNVSTQPRTAWVNGVRRKICPDLGKDVFGMILSKDVIWRKTCLTLKLNVYAQKCVLHANARKLLLKCTRTCNANIFNNSIRLTFSLFENATFDFCVEFPPLSCENFPQM